ncbi:MAG: helix-turn-helix transcriptional regulator [Tepidisphaeraceae bacterium]|jgi:DNA-binding XRE family transcriptional regulator
MIAGTLTIGGVEYVVVPRSEYEGRVPELPAADHRGERPARAAIQAVIARSLIRRRTAAGLEQKELAVLAGVRAETISRIESGRYQPQRATMERIDKALSKSAKRS